MQNLKDLNQLTREQLCLTGLRIKEEQTTLWGEEGQKGRDIEIKKAPITSGEQYNSYIGNPVEHL